MIKVESNEKRGRSKKETVIELHQTGAVAIEVYFQFEHVNYMKNSLFPFPLVTAKLLLPK